MERAKSKPLTKSISAVACGQPSDGHANMHTRGGGGGDREDHPVGAAVRYNFIETAMGFGGVGGRWELLVVGGEVALSCALD